METLQQDTNEIVTAKKKYLRASDILGQNDIKYEDVEVPEWGDDAVVRIKSLTAYESTVFSRTMKSEKGQEEGLTRIVALSVVDEDGTPVFTDEHLPALKRKSLRALKRIQDAALKLNGINADGQKAKND